MFLMHLLLLYLISLLSEFVKMFKIAKLQVLSFIAFAQSLCSEMFQMHTAGRYKGTFEDSQLGHFEIFCLQQMEVTFLHCSLLSRFSFVFM